MKNKSTKIVVLLLVIVLIISVLAAGVGAMIFTGKIALTDKQKLVKGISDIKTRFSSEYTQEDDFIQDYEKMYETPFEAKTIITGKVNTLDIEGADSVQGVSQILEEIKEIVDNTKITSTVQANMSKQILVENVTLEMGDVIEEISLDLEYNDDTIAIRSKELNEKYLTISKENLVSNSQYEDLLESFEILEQLFKKQDLSNIKFTEEEIQHFKEYYDGVISKYLTDDMITSADATITVDGQEVECSAVSVTFAKQQIQEIVGEYLKLFESDSKGKKIILNKLNSLETEITESDIDELIEDLRSELQTLSADEKIVFTIYCNNFTTYGFDMTFEDSVDASIIKTIFETDVTTIGLIESEEQIQTQVGTIIIKENEMNLNFNADDASINVDLREEGNKTIISAGMTADGVSLNVELVNEQITNTETETSEKNNINLAVKSEEMVIDVTLNLDSNFKYVSSIPTTTLTTSNSLDIVTGAQTDLQQYIIDATPKAQALLQTAQQNSLIVQSIMTSMNQGSELENSAEEIINETESTTQNQAVQTFNSLFANYQGNQTGSSIRMLLQTVVTSNQSMPDREIKVIFVENNAITLNTSSPAELLLEMDNIVNTGSYTMAIAEYTDEGYIKTIAIKKN